MTKPVYVAGIGMTPLGKHLDKSVKQQSAAAKNHWHSQFNPLAPSRSTSWSRSCAAKPARGKWQAREWGWRKTAGDFTDWKKQRAW